MSRTNVWSDTQPADANPANTAALVDRVQRLDIRELVNQLIGVDEATSLADPVVASTKTHEGLDTRLTALEGVAGFYNASYDIPILASAFKADGAAGSTFFTSAAGPVAIVGGGSPASMTLNYGFSLPVGSILNSATFYIHSNGTQNSGFTYRIYKKTLNAVSTTNTILATATKSSSWAADTMNTLALSSLAETIVAGVAYALLVNITPAGVDTLYFSGVSLNITTPSIPS